MVAWAKLSFCCLLMAAQCALATSWPMFRGGPALTGVASGMLASKLELLWKVKTGAVVKSSAAIDGERVFIGSGDARMYGLTLADGKKLWEFKATAPVESSPLAIEGKVFFGS